jgi:hypothetical protein
MGWRDLITEPVEVPAELLDTPTLGAYRRAHGLDDDLCVEARVALAVELVEEARRRIVLDRLDGIAQFLVAGATVDQAAPRIALLLQELDHDHRRTLGAAA